MSDLLKTPAIFKTFHPLVDGSVNLTFQTQEIDKQFKSDMLDMHRAFGWLLFSPNDIQMDMVPDDAAKPTIGISPSKRMKNTLYALYMEMGAPYGKAGFDKFYQERLERFRNMILDEISKVKGDMPIGD